MSDRKRDTSVEPFPTMTPPRKSSARSSPVGAANGDARRRRASSSLGGDPHGDTDVPALATSGMSVPSNNYVRSKDERPHSKRRKVKRLLRRWKQISLRHTWLTPLVIILAILPLYLVNPTPKNPVHKLLFVSYPDPNNVNANGDIQYGKGIADFAFVGFYIVVLSFTREFLMQRFIRPIAIKCGIRSRAKQARFMEQFYTAMYFGLFGPFGMWIMSRTNIWYFNTDAFYEGFPHKTHDVYFKAYYLLQASYWAQQMIVLLLMLEKPRKDFKELVAHHIITLSLIWLSYRFHFTHMGLAVYITHDVSDFFLATSKIFNYLDLFITAPYYFLFIGVWTYMRHVINLRILYSILTTFSTIGPYELNWETQQYKCWLSQGITFFLLASLQAVNLFWLFLIFRIAWRFVATWGEVREDERSEYEGSDAEGEANGKEANGPKVHLNGKPVEGEEGKPPVPNKSRERKKTR